MSDAIETEIIQACTLFFGNEAVIDSGFLSTLNPDLIGRTFRKKALLTHPDRFSLRDEETKRKAADLFINVTYAREKLLNFCKQRDQGAFRKTFREAIRKPQKPAAARPRHPFTQATFYKGHIPQRELRFGEFLYYSGAVPWSAFIRALLWQRQQRPRFGDIAIRWRYLTDQKLAFLVARKMLLEPIGKAAVRMNTMSQFQVGTVLYYQRRIQDPLGEYFIETGHLTREQVDCLHDRFRQHNDHFRKPSWQRSNI